MNPTRAKLQDFEETVLLMEPDTYDDAILGLAERAGGLMCVAYDRQRVIEILMSDGMDRDEAEEYFEFNVVSAYMGEGTPVFIDTRFAE